jgi:hypothetical protein
MKKANNKAKRAQQAKMRKANARKKQVQNTIKQIQKENPQGSIIMGLKEDFDIPEWNDALNSYVKFCSLFKENKIPFEAGNTIKFGDYVISFDSDAKGYFDKDKAYVCHYSTGTGYGKVTDLLHKMIWNMEQPTPLLNHGAEQPEFLEWVDAAGKTAIERAGWTPDLLKLDSTISRVLAEA